MFSYNYEHAFWYGLHISQRSKRFGRRQTYWHIWRPWNHVEQFISRLLQSGGKDITFFRYLSQMYCNDFCFGQFRLGGLKQLRTTHLWLCIIAWWTRSKSTKWLTSSRRFIWTPTIIPSWWYEFISVTWIRRDFKLMKEHF